MCNFNLVVVSAWALQSIEIYKRDPFHPFVGTCARNTIGSIWASLDTFVYLTHIFDPHIRVNEEVGLPQIMLDSHVIYSIGMLRIQIVPATLGGLGMLELPLCIEILHVLVHQV